MTRALIRRAVMAARSRPAAPDGWPRVTGPAAARPLAQAAALHALALARHRLRPAELIRLGRAWSHAFADPATERALLARELALGADGRSDVGSRLERRVHAELAWLVKESGMSLKGLQGGPALEAATAEVRGDLLDDLEAQAEAIAARTRANKVLPSVEEWHAMARLRAGYQEATRRLERADRHLAYAVIQPALSAVAVHLFNVRKERSIGHATFAFLAAEAEPVGDTGLAELHRKNVRCGW